MEPQKVKDWGLYSSDDRAEFAVKELDEAGTFVGYASVFGKKDLDNEIVEAGAFKRTVDRKKGKFPILWQHNRDEPIGIIEGAEEDEKGLKIRGRLSMGVSRARDAYALLKDGVVKGLSIGFRVIKDEWDKTSGVRRLKEIDLWEVSVVTFPANPSANVASVKATGYRHLPIAPMSEQPWDEKAATARIASWSGEASSDEEKQARLDSAYLHGSKLLIADVLHGELRCDPRALDHAAAQVFGAKSEIPEKDIPAVKAHIERYYQRLGTPAPWEAQKSLDGLCETVVRLLPHASESSMKALRAALSCESNPSDSSPFDWLFHEMEPEPVQQDRPFAWLEREKV